MPLPAQRLRFVPADDKTVMAPELSLRGGQRPTWRPEREARGSALGVQSREGTSSSCKVSIKTHRPIASAAALPAQPLAALPPYGCGVPLAGSDRLVQSHSTAGGHWCTAALPDVSLRGAKRRGNLAVHNWITGRPRRKRKRLLEIATAPSGPRNDKLGSLMPMNLRCMICKCTRRSLSAATDAIGIYHFNGSQYELGVHCRERHAAPGAALTIRTG